MKKDDILRNTAMLTANAVAHYWQTRAAQRRRQEESGKADHGSRSAVTGGAQMDGFIDLFTELITRAGISDRYIFRKKAVELPDFFRPTKEWDLLVVSNRTLIAAIEAKSQVGPSFGNNFNNPDGRGDGKRSGPLDGFPGAGDRPRPQTARRSGRSSEA
jgi:hypothetical protein